MPGRASTPDQGSTVAAIGRRRGDTVERELLDRMVLYFLLPRMQWYESSRRCLATMQTSRKSRDGWIRSDTGFRPCWQTYQWRGRGQNAVTIWLTQQDGETKKPQTGLTRAQMMMAGGLVDDHFLARALKVERMETPDGDAA